MENNETISETLEVRNFVESIIKKQSLEKRVEPNFLIGKVQGDWKIIGSAVDGRIKQLVDEHIVELATYDSIYIVDIRNPNSLIKYDKDAQFINASRMYR